METTRKLTIRQAAKLLLIAVKNSELVIFPDRENVPDYIQILEDAVNNSTKECDEKSAVELAAPDLAEALIEAYKELTFHNWQNTKSAFKAIEALSKAGINL